MSDIKAVLFDLDGTLADTALDLGWALNEQRRLHGLPPLSRAAIREQASHGTRGLLQLGFGLSPEASQFSAMRAEYLALYEKSVCRHTVLFPGIATVLTELEGRSILWGVVTNKPAQFTLPLLEHLGLNHRAACVISGDSTANCKPHPEPLLMACSKISLAPQECLYVGDAQRDVEAAHAAGMKAIIANYGYLSPADQSETWAADGEIDTPEDILKYLSVSI